MPIDFHSHGFTVDGTHVEIRTSAGSATLSVGDDDAICVETPDIAAAELARALEEMAHWLRGHIKPAVHPPAHRSTQEP